MKRLQKVLIQHKYFLLIVLFYLVFHLINLTLLPIFNDESIYLDWSWNAAHIPGRLYDSLTDAKQPLMLWIFGFFTRFFDDPLYAGRFASVLVGLTTLIGIYVLSKRLFTEGVALFASFLFAVTPIFVFYNRQALLEAGVLSIGIWICLALLTVLKSPTSKNGIILGIVFGIGFYIKSSSLLFMLSSLIIIGYFMFKKNEKSLIAPTGLALAAFVMTNILLFINPLFWEMLPTNSRYSLTIGELFQFPFGTWFENIAGFFEISFFYLTPLLFIVGLFGVIKLFQQKKKEQMVFLIFFISALFIELMTVKAQIQRYLVPFLPFLLITASYILYSLWKGNVMKKGIVTAAVILPIFASTWLITNPDQYIMQYASITKYSETFYVRGQTSGYGINESIQYVRETSDPTKPTMLLFGRNSGNPENAANLYSHKSKHLFGMYMDAQLFQGIEQFDCIGTKYPAYLITRHDQVVGMERFFVLQKTFPQPDNNYSVRIYTIKSPCEGKTIDIDPFYEPSFLKISENKSAWF